MWDGMALTATAEAQQGTKRTVIMIIVILLHLGAFWALQNGLAHHHLVDILPNDIKTKIIEEQKDEPPPPPPPPPDVQTPPPPFVPPVEVTIATPTEAAVNTITTTTVKPPVTAPPVLAPPAIHKAGFDPKHPIRSAEDFYPEASIRASEEGVTTLEVYVSTEGRVTDVRIKTSSGFDRLDQAAIRYAKTFRMLPQTSGGVAEGSWVTIPIRWKIVNR